MLHPIIANEIGKIRHKELIKEAEEYRKAKKFSNGRPFHLPKLNHLFTGRKSEKKVAVTASQTN